VQLARHDAVVEIRLDVSYGSFAVDCIAIGYVRWAKARTRGGMSDSSYTDFTAPGSWLKTTMQGPGS